MLPPIQNVLVKEITAQEALNVSVCFPTTPQSLHSGNEYEAVQESLFLDDSCFIAQMLLVYRFVVNRIRSDHLHSLPSFLLFHFID
jgi:hypothetical protein